MRRTILAGAAFWLGASAAAAASPHDTALLLRELAPLANARSFRAEYVVDVRGEPEKRTHGEFVAPDRVRERDDAGGDLIFIGPALYVKYPSGWKRAPNVGNVAGFAQTPNLAAYIRRAKSDFTLLGTQSADGVPAHLYQHVSPARGDFPGETTRIWIGVRDHALRKVRTESGNVTQTIVYSDWNAPLSIEAPPLQH